MDMPQEPFYAEIYRKKGAPQDRDYRKNAAPQDRGTRFVRACAVEMNMDMSQVTRAFLCGNL